MSDTEKLLPCPFCGSEARLATWSEGKGAQISCNQEGCRVSQDEWYGDTVAASATAAWNRRAEPPHSDSKNGGDETPRMYRKTEVVLEEPGITGHIDPDSGGVVFEEKDDNLLTPAGKEYMKRARAWKRVLRTEEDCVMLLAKTEDYVRADNFLTVNSLLQHVKDAEAERDALKEENARLRKALATGRALAISSHLPGAALSSIEKMFDEDCRAALATKTQEK